MVWLPADGGKIGRCLFLSTEFVNVTDGRTDEWTPHDAWAALVLASRQKLTQFKC